MAMNKKRWLIVGIAILFVVVSGVSSIGLTSSEDEEDVFSTLESFNPYAMILGNQEPTPEIIEDGNPDSRILVIPISGVIGQESTGYQHETILSAIEQASMDESIQAILLEIDTPGGAVYHTHEVYNELLALKENYDMPIYASMGTIAASAGYYFAMAADHVYASPHTITGSIGVIMQNYDVSELMDEVGVKSNVIKSGEMKDIMSSSRPMTDEEEEVLQAYIDEAFDEFISVVDANRDNLSESEIRTLADGRIYSGRQALDNGLIDELGYFTDTLEAMKEAEGLEDAQVFQYVQEQPFDLFSGFPFGQSEETNDLAKFIQDAETAQQVTIEYRWEGAPAYEW